jgi:hypothetical protein
MFWYPMMRGFVLYWREREMSLVAQFHPNVQQTIQEISFFSPNHPPSLAQLAVEPLYG